MKTYIFTPQQFHTIIITSFLCFFLMFLPDRGYAQFQMNYGTSLDNSFYKVIPDGTGYYVLGQNELAVGALPNATVTYLNANGTHKWTLTMDIPSVWNDAVLDAPSGDLLVVGSTLPFDPNSQSLMARVTEVGGLGTFLHLRRYDEFGRDAFNRIVENPVPDNPAFPYYVLGIQNQPGATPTTDDVVLLNVDADCKILWKKSISTSGDDEWSRDLEALATGDLLLAGNDANGEIFMTDNTGTVIGGVQIPQVYFTDVGREASGGVYAAANSFNNDAAFIMKFDQNLFLSWYANIPQLKTVRQIWEASPGIFYVTGRGFFGGANRDVVIKLADNPPLVPMLFWVKYLNAGSGYKGGTAWNLPPNGLAFSDARVLTGGFGGDCAFISVSDLELSTCMVSDTLAELKFLDPFPNGPLFPLTEPFPLPMGVDFPGFLLMWQQDTVCTNAPCGVDIVFTDLDNCGLVQVCANPTGPGPYSYQWCDGRVDSCFTTQLTCGTHDFCVSVTCADGTVATDSASIVLSDTIPPTALCLGVGVDLDANCMATITPSLIDGGSSDNCRIDTMTVSPSVVSGCGLFPVTLTVTDWCGNMSTCTTNVQTIEVVPPIIICPPNVQVACDNDISPAITGTATATDNCDPSPSITFSDVAQGQFPCDGVIQRTWKAEDNCGNMSTCVQNILVFDNVPPVLTNCPPDVSVIGTFNAVGLCEADVQVVSPVATDNCDTSLVLTNSFNNTGNASGIYPQGMTTVVWTVRDDCGNVDTCSFVVTVECDTPMADSICGKSVATCYAQSPSSAVGVIYDTRFNSTAPLGDDWGGGSSPVAAIHPPGWVADSIGQVFGIALDTNGQIYLAATDVYRFDFSFFNAGSGPGGTAGVYKTNINNPAVTNTIVFTNAVTNLSPVAGNMLPNTGGLGNGIGNIAYDQPNDQLFLTNLEDGRIYRVSPSGTLLSSYDPFSLNDGIAGIEKPEERLWGIGLYNNRVYFAREESTSNPKQIWSIGLDGAGEFLGTETPASSKVFTGPAQLEINNGPGLQAKYTDIAFASDGRMTIAERGAPHSAGVFEFKTPGAWVFNHPYYVGVSSGLNSAGGVDYFNREINGDPSAQCDSMIWATGNCMDAQLIGGFGCEIYGMEGIATSGNSSYPSNSGTDIFIDFDQNYVGQQKFQIGDVEVFKCGCRPAEADFPCDSLMVSKHIWDQDSCCYSADFGIHAGPVAFVEVESLTPGVNFSTAVLGSGVMWANAPTSTLLSIKHDTFQGFPQNNYPNALNFCLGNILTPAQDTQCVVFRWWVKGPTDIPYVACTDTCYFYCDPPIIDTCLAVVKDSVFCNPDNPYEYCINLTVENTTGSPGFIANQLILNSFTSGIEFKPCGSTLPITSPSIALNIVPPIGPGQTNTTPLCAKIVSSSPITSPTQFCFDIGLSGADTCCNNSIQHCVTLIPCCDPCENTAIVVHPTNPDSCCFSLDITNDCKFEYFTGIQVVLNTPGVIFGSHYTGGPNSGDWYTSPSTNNLIEWHHIQKYVPHGTINGLINFCLDEIDDPSEVPQSVTINWLVAGANGKDSIACDTTLFFDCEPIDHGCIEVVSDTVKCHKDLNGNTYYEYCLTFLNNSTPPHVANQLVFTPIGSPLVNPFPNPVLFPNLPAGNQATINTFFPGNGLNPGDKLTFVVRLHDASYPNGDDWCCFEGDTICVFIPNCDTCACLGFENLSFSYGDPAAGWNVPVSCGNDSTAVLPWIPVDGLYEFHGNLHCSDSCAAKVDYSVVSAGGTVISGTAVTGYTGGGLNYFDIIPGIHPAPGNYQLVLIGHCGADSCICRINFMVPNCDTCSCGTYSDMSYRPFQGAPNINAVCGDTLIAQCDGPIPWTLGGNFQCAGTGCPPTTQMYWMLMNPNGSVSTDSMTASPGFNITIPASDFNTTGCYQLTLKSICGQDTCYCDFVVKVQCDTCCTDFDAFCQKVVNAVTITVDNDSCKATLNIGDLGDCNDYIEYVDWGIPGQISQGPFHSGDMPMQVYPGSGSYVVCYLAIELDAAGFICFEKLVCDTIDVVCDTCCTDFDAFCQRVENAVSVSVDNNVCAARLIIGDLGGCDDYLEYVDWGDTQIDNGPFVSGDLLNHVYPGSGTYVVSWLAIELDDNGNICFEKILQDTITLMCSGCQCDSLQADVNLGFSVVPVSAAEYQFQPLGLLDGCDSVIWRWGDNSGDSFSSGNDAVTHSFPNSVPYDVCMEVQRIDDNGLVCVDSFCMDVTSVDMLDLENSIHLFPNPTSGTLTLEFTGAIPKSGAVQVFDIYGRLLGKEGLPIGQRTHQLSVEALPAGMYFVQITEGGAPVWAEKVIKQ